MSIKQEISHENVFWPSQVYHVGKSNHSMFDTVASQGRRGEKFLSEWENSYKRSN